MGRISLWRSAALPLFLGRISSLVLNRLRERSEPSAAPVAPRSSASGHLCQRRFEFDLACFMSLSCQHLAFINILTPRRVGGLSTMIYQNMAKVTAPNNPPDCVQIRRATLRTKLRRWSGDGLAESTGRWARPEYSSGSASS